MLTYEECEHEKVAIPFTDEDRSCPDCGMIFVYCHPCSLAGGAERGIYHCEPACPSGEKKMEKKIDMKDPTTLRNLRMFAEELGEKELPDTILKLRVWFAEHDREGLAILNNWTTAAKAFGQYLSKRFK